MRWRRTFFTCDEIEGGHFVQVIEGRGREGILGEEKRVIYQNRILPLLSTPSFVDENCQLSGCCPGPARYATYAGLCEGSSFGQLVANSARAAGRPREEG